MNNKKELFSENYRTLLLLAVVTVTGAYYRFLNIGSASLWVDEYYHVIASKSILNGAGPLLPSGLSYGRGIIFTLLVSLSQVIFGANTIAFRLPSLIFGILLIPASYFLLKKLSLEKVGLIVAFFIAFDPFSFIWSRISRMYSMFEFFFFISAVLLFKLLSELSFDRKSLKLWAVFALAFGVTVSLQPLGLILPVAACTYLFFAYLLKLNEKNNLIVFILSIVGLFTTFFVLFMVDYLIPTNYFLLTFKQINTYFILLTALAFGYCLFRRKNIGVFAGSIFFTALTIHSYFFSDWQKSRYMIYAVPFAYVLMATPVADLIELVLKDKKKIVKDVAVGLTAVLIIFSSKSLVNRIYDLKLELFPKYEKAMDVLKKGAGENKDVIIISTLPATTTYYYGKTDYWLRSSDFQRYTFKKNGKFKEIYSGAVLLNDARELKKITEQNKDVWIFADSRLYAYGDQSIRQTIKKYFERVYFDKEFSLTVLKSKTY